MDRQIDGQTGNLKLRERRDKEKKMVNPRLHGESNRKIWNETTRRSIYIRQKTEKQDYTKKKKEKSKTTRCVCQTQFHPQPR